MSSARAHAEYDELNQYGTVENLAPAMQKFVLDVRMLLKIPSRSGIEFARRLMIFLAKSVYCDLD